MGGNRAVRMDIFNQSKIRLSGQLLESVNTPIKACHSVVHPVPFRMFQVYFFV